MNPSNTISVATLIAEIQSELNDQTGSWRKVSGLLNQADVEFGFGADEMKQILDQTDISPSKAMDWAVLSMSGCKPSSFYKSICSTVSLDDRIIEKSHPKMSGSSVS